MENGSIHTLGTNTFRRHIAGVYASHHLPTIYASHHLCRFYALYSMLPTIGRRSIAFFHHRTKNGAGALAGADKNPLNVTNWRHPTGPAPRETHKYESTASQRGLDRSML